MQTSQRLGVLQPFRVGKITMETRNAVVYDAVRSYRRSATRADMQTINCRAGVVLYDWREHFALHSACP